MIEWAVAVIAASGLLGLAALMFAENVFPPIPSELIMPLAGFAAARGELGLPGVVLAGTAGALLGALLWYAIGRKVGARRLKSWAASYGRWLTLSPMDVDRACGFFRRWGGPAVLIGRVIPGVRTYVSVPAGISRMKVFPFLCWSAAGTALWTGLLAYAGYRLEARYNAVDRWLDPLASGVLGLTLLVYVFRVLTFQPGAR